jgi:hypothetical protein
LVTTASTIESLYLVDRIRSYGESFARDIESFAGLIPATDSPGS